MFKKERSLDHFVEKGSKSRVQVIRGSISGIQNVLLKNMRTKLLE